jgi:hypothetical protein
VGSLGHSGLCGKSGLSFCNEHLECAFVLDGDIRKNFAIQVDSASFQALNKAAVGEAVGSGRGVDALLPEHPEVTFAGFPVAEGPVLGFHHGILGVPEQFGAASAKAFRFLDRLFTTGATGGAVCGSWHRISVLFFHFSRLFSPVNVRRLIC